MTDSIITAILASVFIPIFLAIPIYMLCAGLMSGAVLTRTPQYTKKSKFNKVCVALSMGISMLNALLSTIPDNKRVFTIESGSRELSLVRKKGNKIINNVVHTLSRPSDNEAYDITQEDLVVASLRFNPDIVCVGEMRDVECYSAVEECFLFVIIRHISKTR